MPKYCKAAHCYNCAGQLSGDNRKLSFYKFPLHNKERLQQWLINMNREKMVPTKHQHLCSEHFTASCFEWRWGIRYLKPNSVPTIFQHTGNSMKRTNVSKTGVRKKFMLDSSIACTSPTQQAVLVRPLSESQDLKTLAITFDPCLSSTPLCIEMTQASAKDLDIHRASTPVGSVNLLPIIQIVEPFQGVSFSSNSTADITAPVHTSGRAIADAGVMKQLDTDVELSHEATEDSIVVEFEENLESAHVPNEYTGHTEGNECASSFVLEEAPATYEMDEINWPGALIIKNVSIDPLPESDVSPSTTTTAQKLHQQLSSEATDVSPVQTDAFTLVTVLPETVLSSAIARPIVSTLPVVSNHANIFSPGSLQPTASNIACEVENSQLENMNEPPEPLGLPSSAANEQLVALVVCLQKKVKLLQQRHRRHHSKIKSMERIVEELWKENLISEEKLKMLEMACLQSNMEVSETVGSVAILCQNDDNKLVYAPPQHEEAERETITHQEENKHSG